MDQLSADGFNAQDIEKLEDLAAVSIDVARLEDLLANAFAETTDLGDESELTEIMEQWSGQIGWPNIWRKACQTGFPDPIDAIAFVSRAIFSIAASAYTLEAIKRNPPEEDNLDTNLDPSFIKEGIELAELGMEEDMATWPAY